MMPAVLTSSPSHGSHTLGQMRTSQHCCCNAQPHHAPASACRRLQQPAQRSLGATVPRQRSIICAPALQPGVSTQPSQRAHQPMPDCWPGCSRASWIEGPQLSTAGAGASGTMVSAAALAEPPADAAVAGQDADDSSDSLVGRVGSSQAPIECALMPASPGTAVRRAPALYGADMHRVSGS